MDADREEVPTSWFAQLEHASEVPGWEPGIPGEEKIVREHPALSATEPAASQPVGVRVSEIIGPERAACLAEADQRVRQASLAEKRRRVVASRKVGRLAFKRTP